MTPYRLIVAGAVAVMMGCAAQNAHADDPCFYNSKRYSDGGASCQGGREYRCDNGEWLSTSNACDLSGPEIAAKGRCDYAGISFSPGSASCQAGTQFRCDEDGEWTSLRVPCAAGDAPVRVMPSGKTCMFGGATVASGSTICQSGSTFVCNDGEWFNLGTLCR